MNYLQPTTLSQLQQALAQCTSRSVIAAGCTDYLLARQTRPEPDLLVSLTHLPQLQQIDLKEDTLYIGAMCTHTMLSRHPLVQQYLPALAQACRSVGSEQIRNRGTLGGNLCTGSAASDLYPVCLASGAQMHIMNGSGQLRQVNAADFYQNQQPRPGEVLTQVCIPVKPEKISAFAKLGSRSVVTISRINLAISANLQAGHLADVQVALGALSPHAFLCPEAAAQLSGASLPALPAEAFCAALRDALTSAIGNRASFAYKHAAIAAVADEAIHALREMR